MQRIRLRLLHQALASLDDETIWMSDAFFAKVQWWHKFVSAFLYQSL